jgi:hypothetical protein
MNEHVNHSLEIEDSNPATGTGIEKMAKSNILKKRRKTTLA